MAPRLPVARTTVLALAGLASQGCASSGGSWSIDLVADGSVSDAQPAHEASADVEANPCGTVPPHGRQLVASPSVALDGVTSDGFAIYTDVATMTVNAVPLTGGAPTKIGNVDANNAVFVSGKVVYFEPAVVPGTGLGLALLSVWTAASGTASLSPCVPIPPSAAASGNGLADVSSDGSYLLYVGTQDGETGTLMVATTDGKTKLPLVADVDLLRPGCRPFVEFAGTSAVAAYCVGATDAGVGTSPDAGVVPDAGVAPEPSTTLDSGVAPDVGALRDAAATPDATVPRDAGGRIDASVPVDAGAVRDASLAPDAPGPSGPPDAGSRDGGRRFRDTGAGDDGFAAADATVSDGGRTGRLVQAALTDSPAPNNDATLATFSGPTFVQRVLATNAQPAFSVDVGGAHVLASVPSGLVAYPVAASGAGIPIDATGKTGIFTKDGAYVVYVTSAMALKRSSLASPAPESLVSGGLGGVFGLSPDENWVLGFAAQANRGQTSDLFVASAATAGTTRRLSAWADSAIFGDAFTADSSHVLYFDNISSTGAGGDFYVANVSGGARTMVASNAWIAAATTGSKVLLSANCATCSDSTTGPADLVALDAQNPARLVTLVSQAYASFYLTADRDRVVYSWTCTPDRAAGVYVLPVP